jgi:hypothetical protein
MISVMNAPTSSLRRRFVAAAALFLAAVCVMRADLPASDSLVPLPVDPGVTRGMDCDEVVWRLGEPALKDPLGIWVYWNFKAMAHPSGGVDTLVIFFAKGRVIHLRLTERKAVVALLEQLRRNKAQHASATPRAAQ